MKETTIKEQLSSKPSEEIRFMGPINIKEMFILFRKNRLLHSLAVAIFGVIPRNAACLSLLLTMSKLRVFIGGIKNIL